MSAPDLTRPPIDIMLASDRRGVEPVTVAAYSAIRHASRPVRVWMVEQDIEPELQARMTAQWAGLPMFAGATFTAVRALPVAFPLWWRRPNWPTVAWARLQVAELLPADAVRCIYLDYDTLTGTDLAELADMNLHGHPVAMVPNARLPADMAAYVAGMLQLDPERYCNSGVLVADLALWRRDRLGARLIAHGNAMPPSLWFPDQDMLNSFFRDDMLLLAERWNMRDTAQEPDGNILHYAGKAKPWRTLGDPPQPALVAWRQERDRLDLHVEPRANTRGLGDRAALVAARLQRKLIEAGRRLKAGGRG